MTQEIPLQEQARKWFRSHLLGREVELQELYELPQIELDLLMAETAEIRSDIENRARSHGRFRTLLVINLCLSRLDRINGCLQMSRSSELSAWRKQTIRKRKGW